MNNELVNGLSAQYADMPVDLPGETQADSQADAQQALTHMIRLKWLQSFEEPAHAPDGTIEERLPELLQQLSSDGRALLADDQGFYLACAGFTHEAAEELSALSGDLASLSARHEGILHGNLKMNSSAFAVVDAGGYSQLGFWPLFIGETAFVLVVSGVPRFDQAAFVDLVWYLHKRYYSGEDEKTDAA
ncbi:MAG TPA: hypothetical protein ENJ64_03175 [Thiotrichales bacterium]|nr:hypothetical protein [Thiotrichales bacterium]